MGSARSGSVRSRPVAPKAEHNAEESVASSTFMGVKVFSATLFAARERLGEDVTAWIAAHPEYAIDDIEVRQSSDAGYHCLSITVFYGPRLARDRHDRQRRSR